VLLLLRRVLCWASGSAPTLLSALAQRQSAIGRAKVDSIRSQAHSPS